MENVTIENFKKWSDMRSNEIRNHPCSIIFNHFGTFSEDFVYRLSDVIEKKVIEIKHDYKLSRRLISTVNEMILNINKYGKSSSLNIAHLLICFNDDGFYVEVSNPLRKGEKSSLMGKIEEINTLSHKELLNRYYELKKRSLINNTDGLGVGMLTIRINCSNKIGCDISKINDEMEILTISCHADSYPE